MGREEPLPIRPLPEAPDSAHILGPGLVLTALGVGLGETFMWPRLMIAFGPQIRWLFMVGLIIQTFVTMEMARWAMATGESIFFGAARIHRSVMWFFAFVALITYIWPGHVTLGAQSLQTITGIPWTVSAIVGLILVALILTFAKNVYETVEGILSTLISLLVVGSALIAVFIGHGQDLWDTIWGSFAFGYTRPEFFTKAWFPILVGSVAFAGPSGMQQMWYTLYLRDKGAGMGRYIPKIKGLLSGGEEESIPSRGFAFDADHPAEQKKWQGWRKWNAFDAIVLFFGVTLLTTIIYTVLAMAATRISPDARSAIMAGQQTAALAAMAKAFGSVGGPVAFYAFYAFVAIVGWKMTFGIFDAFARGQADMTYFFLPGAKRWRMSTWYYIFLFGTLAIGIVTVLSGSAKGPTFILNTLAFLSSFVMGCYCPVLLYCNNRFLPRAIRPGWVSNLALAAGTLFYLGSLFYSVLVMGAIPSG